MKKSVIATMFGMMFVSSVAAQDVVITSGKAGGTYNGVFGVNLAGAMSEFGYRPQLQPSKGSIDNLNRVASNQSQIGFVQADALMYWTQSHANDAQNIEIIGELGQECIFAAVAKNSKIDNEDDIGKDTKIAVGNPNSGSYASWQYLRSLNKSYAEAKTFAEDGNTTLAKVVTGQIDMFVWVAAKDKPNKNLGIVMAKDSQFKMIPLDDWNLNDKLPNGNSVYSFEESVVKEGTFSDDKVKSPCTTVLVVVNKSEENAQIADDVAGILLTNKGRVTSGK
ncbi:putative TRAP transporter solute receptor [Pseudaeromonas phage vB_PpeM_ KLEP7]|nr:putative TRAP transporter solute receptor [Pseudaeromonas phage vB_PpeM_ KLEP7]